MPAQLFYFTGTGNTLAIAKAIASELGDAAIALTIDYYLLRSRITVS